MSYEKSFAYARPDGQGKLMMHTSTSVGAKSLFNTSIVNNAKLLSPSDAKSFSLSVRKPQTISNSATKT